MSKSRFLAFCLPVSSEQDAADQLSALRKRFYDARHVCYAFRLNGSASRSSDDGEPSGTAGAPILNVLTQNGVEQAMIAVVRYFGGVLLGRGGLVRAYGSAASAALQNAGIEHMRVCRRMQVELSYQSYAALEPVLRKESVDAEAAFGERVTLICTLPEERADAFIDTVTEKTDGAAAITPRDTLLCATRNNG